MFSVGRVVQTVKLVWFRGMNEFNEMHIFLYCKFYMKEITQGNSESCETVDIVVAP